MAIIGHGVDLIECRRIAESIERFGDAFLNRVLTPAEREYVGRKRNPVPHVAGRFAAKEAILKVIGTGWRGRIAWTDIEVLNNELGQPQVTLTGQVARHVEQLGIKSILLSITHTAEAAVASAIGQDE